MPTQLLADLFDRPDENPIASPWTSPGTYACKISGQVLMSGTLGSTCFAQHTGSANFSEDQYNQVLGAYPSPIYNGIVGLFVRVQSDAPTTKHFECRIASSYTRLYSVNGSATIITNGTGRTNGDTSHAWKFTVSGTTLTAYKDGVQDVTGTSATWSSGRADMVKLLATTNDWAAQLDYWDAGNLADAAVGHPAARRLRGYFSTWRTPGVRVW